MGNSFKFHLQPVKEIYLNRDNIGDGEQHGDIGYIWLFSAISAFILLIAFINFINLSTAKSANRAKEVGLRKVVGANKGSLVFRFLSESLLLSMFAFSFGILLTYFLLPYFNAVLDLELSFPWSAWWLLPILFVGMFCIGIIAGIYPAFYMSSFKPIQALSGKKSRGSKSAGLRNTLVVFQFVISVVLIIGTITVNRQMNFIVTKKLGFDKEQVIVLKGTHTLGEKIQTFKQELANISSVKSASITGFLPIAGTNRNNGGWYLNDMLPEDAVSGQQWSVDQDYIKTLGLTLVKGRDFSYENSRDKNAVIINESLANALRLEDPIGQQLTNYRGEWTIIGVVENFHFESMKKDIRPLGFYMRPSSNMVTAKINTQDLQYAIEDIAALWQEFSPNQPIRYNFLDQEFANMYTDINRTQLMLSAFSFIAILVAGLGLFALSSFMIEQRGKEISIRLVLGASVKSIVNLLTSNYIKLIAIAFIIALPISWYIMDTWLQDFVFRIQIGWSIYTITGIIVVAVAMLTITYQSIKAALTKPVKMLRSE